MNKQPKYNVRDLKELAENKAKCIAILLMCGITRSDADRVYNDLIEPISEEIIKAL